MERTPHSRLAVASYTLADAQALNIVKNRLRDITRTLDAFNKVYPHTLEAHQLKHEMVILLTELQIHGLLPETVSVAVDSPTATRVAEEEP
jgi:hypothetical protein